MTKPALHASITHKAASGAATVGGRGERYLRAPPAPVAVGEGREGRRRRHALLVAAASVAAREALRQTEAWREAARGSTWPAGGGGGARAAGVTLKMSYDGDGQRNCLRNGFLIDSMILCSGLSSLRVCVISFMYYRLQ